MASTRISKTSLIIIMFLLVCLVLVSAAHEEDGFAKNMERKVRFRREKLSHFRFYWHNTLSGTNPSAVRIIPPLFKFALKSKFGLLDMTDNPLTEKPELSSKLLGRSQGIYAVTSQERFDLLMAMNFVFVQGKYNGSTITIFGRNPVFSKVREMPVIGGSGLFRFARGYAHANTYSYDTVSGDAIVKYNVYVLHY